jgi:hydrogenase-4 component B
MTLTLVVLATCTIGVSALAAGLVARSDRMALALGSAGAVGGCALGLGASLLALLREDREALATPFRTALGPLLFGIDPLSAFFLVCVFLVSGLAAVYGVGYLRAYLGRRRLALAVAAFNVLVAAMATVVLARDGVLFLTAWEVMSISSFFLVSYDSDREDVRRAGLTYLVASHAGVALLIVLFAILARSTGQFDFAGWSAAALPAGVGGTCFVLALVAFGSKAGFWPLHVWLPEAHPAAPSHVSAVMSGVMIKIGIYGLLRTLEFLGPAPAWWGALLLGVGVLSGVLGVLHALAQHDLKRLLAYHSVENIGIIAMGLGLGLLGRSVGQPAVAFLGLAGGLLHVLNHGLFKGLLFQAAGSVLHATNIRELDRLGGLSRRMPHTASTFLVGAVAICGLPPLNGFVSEWLLYVGAFRGAGALPTPGAVAALTVIVALALIGGLAAACFVKAYGIVFLGEPRSREADAAHEAPQAMYLPMWLGATLCAAIGLGAPAAVRLVAPVARSLAGLTAAPLDTTGPLDDIAGVAAIVVILVAALAILRTAVLRGRPISTAPTWGCGYAEPTPRMQYTASSFVDPVLAPFTLLFRREVHDAPPEGPFPLHAAHDEHLGDHAEHVLVSTVRRFADALSRLEFLQRGRVQLYLAYVLATLVLLLVWQLTAEVP